MTGEKEVRQAEIFGLSAEWMRLANSDSSECVLLARVPPCIMMTPRDRD